MHQIQRHIVFGTILPERSLTRFTSPSLNTLTLSHRPSCLAPPSSYSPTPLLLGTHLPLILSLLSDAQALFPLLTLLCPRIPLPFLLLPLLLLLLLLLILYLLLPSLLLPIPSIIQS